MVALRTEFLSGHQHSVLRSAAPHLSCTGRMQHLRVQAVVQEPPKKDVRKPRAENVGLDHKGAFFVDHTCIGT